ncbi:hypothetical protein [Enterococcus sp. SMC-9]|uniref:hypothetical protein n=1 Tax=Enterococcus sp. SMC-9 TaxID=2862343 RepID=UPI001E2D09AC|nr:hypothetical protein [Enterococcus sp. SMC-9]MCD1025235.1 hypothetical protein [Enterococcus sp. SMC-9]
MDLELAVKLTEDLREIYWEKWQSHLYFVPTKKILPKVERGIYITTEERQVKTIELTDPKSVTQPTIVIEVPWEIEPVLLLQHLVNVWEENGLEVITKAPTEKIPSNQYDNLATFQLDLFSVFNFLGYPMAKVKKKPAKAQHRWNKKVSDITFHINHEGATGEAIWRKRNELVLLKGAKLKAEAPLNKDGSVGFAVRFTNQLRDENADKVKDFTTIADIVFKSVNELGNFLYFAGTNSWLVLKDDKGNTIDSYTVVK